MKEKTLVKLSIICALLGIFALYIISDNIEINESSIGRIEKENVGQDIKVKGVVKDVFNSEKATIITITKPEDAKIIVMGNVSLNKGDYVEVIGSIDEYNGKMELIGDRIRVIS